MTGERLDASGTHPPFTHPTFTSPQFIPPQFTPEEQAGLRDLWEALQTHRQEIHDSLMHIVQKLPMLARAVKMMTPEQMEENERISQAYTYQAFIECQWEPLLTYQRQQGAMYAAMGISFNDWFELVGAFQAVLIPHLITRFASEPDRLAKVLIVANRHIDLNMSMIGEEYLRTKERIIVQQQHAIQELSTPVLQIRERLLLVPLVGVLDTQRARFLTEQLLHAIRAHRAKVVVIDITGVPAVDSRVANHLFQTVAAARLMGAQAVITGLSAEVAQAMVTLGIETEKLNTVGDLQGGLEEADRLLGYRHVQVAEPLYGYGGRLEYESRGRSPERSPTGGE